MSNSPNSVKNHDQDLSSLGPAKLRGVDVSSFIPAKAKAAYAILASDDRQSDRLRSVMNLWFTPSFRPRFVDDATSKSSSLDGIQLQDPTLSIASRVPMRMFDIDTGNIVEGLHIGSMTGQYCVLSHSWKGHEIDYAFLARVKRLDAKRVTYEEELEDGNADAGELAYRAKKYSYLKPTKSSEPLSDVQMIMAQVSEDVRQQAAKIKCLVGDMKEYKGLEEHAIVAELLKRRIEVRVTESKRAAKTSEYEEAVANRDYAFMEDTIFGGLVEAMGINPADVAEDSTAEDPEKLVADAETDRIDAESAYEKLSGDIQFFQANGRLSEAVDKMVDILQQRKSANKIQQSIEQAKRIFDEKLFWKSTEETRYLWLDTCCINKAIDAELIESLALMGEWYENADLCIVHIDSKRSEEEWLMEWMGGGKPEARIDSFASIDKATPEGATRGDKATPEWATRGWTLQELVLSKSTFYVNDCWQALSRPVESLGPYYYLVPFIDLYIRSDVENPYATTETLNSFENIDVLNNILDAGEVKVSDQYKIAEDKIQAGEGQNSAKFEMEREQIRRAQKLIFILEALGLHIPRGLNRETAKSRIAQGVYSVSARLAPNHALSPDATASISKAQRMLGVAFHVTNATGLQVKQMIDILLRCLVNNCLDLIKADREYIAGFSNIGSLDSWKDGTARSGFTSHKIMSLACNRKCTVATDRAYSLMGLLGVKFPAFQAEGLTKALSRLLDEVVITSNDVSIFNWTGKQLGSPIKGRTLYPATLDAFSPQKREQRQMEKIKKLSHLLQIERYKLMGVFLKTTDELKEAIGFVKDRSIKTFPADWQQWLLWLLESVQTMKLERLEPHLDDIGRILTYIRTTYDKQIAVANTDVEQLHGNDSDESSIFDGIRSQLPSTPVLSGKISKFMGGGKKTEDKKLEPEPKFHPSKLSMGGFKPSLGRGFGKKESGSTTSAGVEHAIVTKSPQSEPSETTNIIGTSGLHNQVENYIKSLPTKTPLKLPDEFNKISITRKDIEANRATPTKLHIDDMVSPYPVVVNNSGIDGVFDIQRVIITLLDSKRLRRQIENAASSSQMISGWCTISTGFALTMTGFSCEKHILARQLDVVDVVKHTVLQERSSEDPQTNSLLRRSTTAMSQTSNSSVDKLFAATRLPGMSSTTNIAKTSETATDQSDDEDEEEGNKDKYVGDTAEARKVQRMLAFVQESNMSSIAGEWVLARFSGVTGAKWFLCQLELGSTHAYHGRRIATDEINFHNASPELGLMDHWETYMRRKKDMLCEVLRRFLQGKQLGDWADRFNHKYQDAKSAVQGPDQPTLSSTEQLSSLAGRGALKVAAAGSTMFQGLLEMHAKHLDSTLSDRVLKTVPAHLQAAIESLNENKDLLPSMFYSGQKIHIF